MDIPWISQKRQGSWDTPPPQWKIALRAPLTGFKKLGTADSNFYSEINKIKIFRGYRWGLVIKLVFSKKRIILDNLLCKLQRCGVGKLRDLWCFATERNIQNYGVQKPSECRRKWYSSRFGRKLVSGRFS